MSSPANSDAARFKLPVPDRDEPMRNTYARGADHAGAGSKATRTGDGKPEAGVAAAYAVIDEYMQRGFEAASKHQQGSEWGRTMQHDEFGQPGGSYGGNPWAFGAPPSGQPLASLMQTMGHSMQQWTQMLQMAQSLPMPMMQQMLSQLGTLMNSWLTMLTGTGQWSGPGYPGPFGPGTGFGSWPAPASAPPPGMSHEELMAYYERASADAGAAARASEPPGEPHANAASNVHVRLIAQQPTEVTHVLPPGADPLTLVAEPLYSDSQDAAPIDVVIGPTADGGVDIAVEVPAHQPSGRYNGPIRTHRGEYVGGLTVVVHPSLRAAE